MLLTAGRLNGAGLGRPGGEPACVIRDGSTVALRFNVMPDLFVEETFFLREYRIWPGYIEADFDRSYASEMKHSPSHVVFLTALAHCQKLAYVYLCHELSLPYDPGAEEKLKVWPTKVSVSMPQMVTPETGLVHQGWILDLRRPRAGQHKAVVRSKIGHIFIEAELIVLTL
jgi:hypothetical protein